MRRQQSPRQCIYCGRKAKITREHIFGKWLKKYLPASEGDKTEHFTSFMDHDAVDANAPTISLSKGRLSRPGAPHVQNIKLLCKHCNGTWLSEIQNSAKPYIIKVLNGDWGSLDFVGVKAIATWATMVTISLEYADSKTQATSAAERERFKQERQPGANWLVYLGICNGAQMPGSFWHRAGYIFESERPKLAKPNFQTTTFYLGRSFVHTLSGIADAIPNAEEYAGEIGLRQFWPTPTRIPEPTGVFNAEGVGRVATHFWTRYQISAAQHLGIAGPEILSF